MKPLDLSKPFIGPLDANDDANLRDYFISFGDFSSVINKNLFVVVGAKGTGKSAIKKHITDQRIEKNQLTVVLDDSHGFPLSELKTQSPAEIKNKMKAYLKTIVIEYLLSSKDIKKEHSNALKKLKGDVPIIAKLIQPLKIRAPLVEYALSDLFPKGKRGELLRLLDPEVTQLIRNSLQSRDLWVFIDDIDRIFTSDNDESSLKFAEGLIYAVSDLCVRESSRQIWTVLLLRSEIYEEMSRIATEFDKEITYVWEIAWDNESLKKCLAERIRWRLSAEKNLPVWKCWSLVFDTHTETETTSLQEYVLERIINGPRDLLLLTDLSRLTAHSSGAAKIALSHIEDSEYRYGQVKLQQITSNFQRIYKDIDKVIDRLFRQQKQVYSRKQLEEHINNHLLTKPKARDDFKHLSWVRTCTPFLFIEILYKTGCIGYWDPSKKQYIHVLHKSNPDKTLLGSTRFKVHSALANYLELSFHKPSKKVKRKH